MNGDTWSSTVSPLAYTGTTWNHGAGFGTQTGTDLLDSNGTVTTVGFTLTGDVAEANGDGFQPLPIFYETEYTDVGGMTLTINGLQNGQPYDLYLASAFNGGDGGFFTVGANTQEVAGTTQSSFISGQNYLEFSSVTAVGNSIVMTIKPDGTNQNLAILNAFQITEAPEPSTYTMLIAGLGLLVFALRFSKSRA